MTRSRLHQTPPRMKGLIASLRIIDREVRCRGGEPAEEGKRGTKSSVDLDADVVAVGVDAPGAEVAPVDGAGLEDLDDQVVVGHCPP